MSTFLVTGAAGFIGSRVTDLLLAEGNEVIGIDNLNSAYDVRLKQWRLAHLNTCHNFRFEQVDICDWGSLRRLFAGLTFTAVLNLAARAGVRQSLADPWSYFETNTTGTLNLLEMCRIYGVPKFILASTSSLYGSGGSMPYSEDQISDRPLSPYAASKKAAETLCYTYHHLYGIDITVFRYFTVYGPAGRPDMSLFRFVKWVVEGLPVTVYGDGQQSRDFTYVDDVARGTIAGLKPLGYEIINLGSDTPIMLRDALHMIEATTAHPAQVEFLPVHKADVRATWADISKAHRLIDWRPKIDIIEGIAEIVNWYQTNRHWAREIETG